MTAITTDDLTTISLEGDGVFDAIMETNRVRLEREYDSGRIIATDYSKVYLGAMEASMSQAVSFLLGRQMASAQADLTIKQGELLDAEIINEGKKGLLIDQQILKLQADIELTEKQVIKMDSEIELLDKQVIKLDSDTALVEKQIIKMDSEIALAEQQVLNMVEEVKLTSKQVDKLSSDILLTDKQIIKMDSEIDLAEQQVLNMIEEVDLTKQQVIKLIADTAVVEVQDDKIVAETALLLQQADKLAEDILIAKEELKIAKEKLKSVTAEVALLEAKTDTEVANVSDTINGVLVKGVISTNTKRTLAEVAVLDQDKVLVQKKQITETNVGNNILKEGVILDIKKLQEKAEILNKAMVGHASNLAQAVRENGATRASTIDPTTEVYDVDLSYYNSVYLLAEDIEDLAKQVKTTNYTVT